MNTLQELEVSRRPQSVQIWQCIVAKIIINRIVFTVFAYFPLKTSSFELYAPSQVKELNFAALLNPATGLQTAACQDFLTQESRRLLLSSSYLCCPRALWDQEHCVDSVYIYLLTKAGTLNICMCQMLSKHTNTQVVKLCALKNALN